jgi:hypothetical protein
MSKQQTARFLVTFNAHVPQKSIESMMSGIAAYGDVIVDESQRGIRLAVSRHSKLSKLEGQLTDWDRFGFLRWSRLDG